ncbi:MAG: hypothetical protein Q9160_005231 [Pyrenula sp. 1 TL-2023]
MSPDTPSSSVRSSRKQRILSCVLCQQRKVKSTAVQRPRRRRFPESELLDRLHKYEDLLRQNNIAFEPLPKSSRREKDSPHAESQDSDDELPEATEPRSSTPSNTVKSEKNFEAKNIWHAMSQGFRDPNNDSDSSDDDIRETVVRHAWDSSVGADDHLLFGSRRATVDLSSLHPNPAQIFRLWQVYLDNVNPLLKVTHTPSLQARIVEATNDITNIDPILEALMFSIYCMSTVSLVAEDRQTLFGSSEDVLMQYQFGCQQALLNCGFLRSSERDCLTALYLYLVSVRPNTAPHSLNSMLGVAIRIASRMGYHNEAALAKCSTFEAEMRRRLWWSLALFDSRVSEIATSKTSKLDPTWDCKIPLNVNDSDLRQEMRSPPTIQEQCTESVVAVVRSELGDFVRHSMFHLDFSNPALKPLARHRSTTEGSEVVELEKLMENQYLRSCDEENPVHFLAIWTTRAYIAKCHLVEHHSRHSNSTTRRTEAQLDTATSHALRMLKCDTILRISPLTRGFRWFNIYHFPFPAYIQILQDLKRRPTSKQAQEAWEVMSENYDAWFTCQLNDDNPFFQMLAKVVLHAWQASEAASKKFGEILTPPRIVLGVKQSMTQMTLEEQILNTEQMEFDISGLESEDFSLPIPLDFAEQNLPYGMGMPYDYTSLGLEPNSSMPLQLPVTAPLSMLGWTT